jgi:hypothetical protein
MEPCGINAALRHSGCESRSLYHPGPWLPLRTKRRQTAATSTWKHCCDDFPDRRTVGGSHFTDPGWQMRWLNSLSCGEENHVSVTFRLPTCLLGCEEEAGSRMLCGEGTRASPPCADTAGNRERRGFPGYNQGGGVLPVHLVGSRQRAGSLPTGSGAWRHGPATDRSPRPGPAGYRPPRPFGLCHEFLEGTPRCQSPGIRRSVS